MALVTSTSSGLNFNVKVPVPIINPNRAPPLTTRRIIKQNIGTSGANIPATALLNNTITVSPSTVNQTYTLPKASDILAEFGKSIDTGVPKLAAGDTLEVRIVNRGAFSAYIAANATGGDGTAIIAPTGASAGSTGATYVVGRITNVFLEWLSVSGGTQGATGQYTVYSNQ